MTYRGTARGKRIELDDSVSLPDGTRVTVDIAPEGLPRRGSPAAVLRLAGTLQPEEADSILHAAQGCRRVDDELWGQGP